MIESARIAGTALIERHTDVAVAGDDRTSERAGNTAGVQYFVTNLFCPLTLLGRGAHIGSKIKKTFVNFEQPIRHLTHDSDMFDSRCHLKPPFLRSAAVNRLLKKAHLPRCARSL